jgi:iron complex transport system permease protein
MQLTCQWFPNVDNFNSMSTAQKAQKRGRLGGAATPTIETKHINAHQRGMIVLFLLVLLLVMFFVLAIGNGAVYISPQKVIAILMNELGLESSVQYEDFQQKILMVRLPRVFLGMLIGASLAVSGAALQGLFRNPLADPSLLGISSGAALSAMTIQAVGSILEENKLRTPWAFAIAAFFGAILTTVIIYQLATTNGRTNVTTMLLAGVAINAWAGAGVGLLSFMSGGAGTDTIFWTLGSLARASWKSIAAVLPFMAASLLILPLLSRSLNALLLGESEAGHLGINVQMTKLLIIIVVALSVGAGVAVAGVVGFVALVVPHLLRFIVGPNHRYILPGSILLGASLLIGADTITRVISTPEVPLGVITSFFGGPFFLWLLLRDRNRGTLL